KAFGDLPVMLLHGGVAVDIAEKAGLTVIRQAFADRNYNSDGTLVSRREPNAVLHDPADVVARVMEVAERGSITAVDGSVLQVDAQSVCTHGDSPGSVTLLREVVAELGRHNIEIRSFASCRSILLEPARCSGTSTGSAKSWAITQHSKP